jgi:hypothetical protein
MELGVAQASDSPDVNPGISTGSKSPDGFSLLPPCLQDFAEGETPKATRVQ